MASRFARAALFCAALGATTGAGCIGERPAINRVQPDYLDKMDFIPVEYGALTNGQLPETLTVALLAREPVYYTQTTLIAKPSSGGFLGMTQYNQADKIRWEVTEHYLIARQAYQFVHGAPFTDQGGVGQDVRTGDVVAAFKIDSHFDIRRAYNPQTGEELNIIEENSVDRPWYQRRYMRVDWSQNLVDRYNSPLELEQWNGTIQSEPVAVTVNDPADPNAPVFQYTGNGDARHLDYFDVVYRSILHPETVSLGGAPDANLCYLSQGGLRDCTSPELTFRLAFRRVDPTRDYEPANLTEPVLTTADHAATPDERPSYAVPGHFLDMERFGMFDAHEYGLRHSGTIGYDPAQHGIFDTERRHFGARHNLWAHHHLLAFGTDSDQGCNRDADCGDQKVCHIGNEPHDATHRGVCAPLAIDHLATDSFPSGALTDDELARDERACQTDDDCRQAVDGSGVSNTAVCDPGTHTCGEHYYRCRADADCAARDPLSTCDVTIAYLRNDGLGMCLMPYRQRQVRPIAYHESLNYPERMQPVTESIVREWNAAFSSAVTAARRRECELANGAASGAPGDNGACATPQVDGTDPALGADAQFVYVGCHSPVWGTEAGKPGYHSQEEVDGAHQKGWDLEACGPQGTSARLGDLRYSMIGAITEVDVGGLWGLANVAADPETGETIAGRGAVWQTLTDMAAQLLIDQVKLLRGDTTPDAVANGDLVVDAVRRIADGRAISDQTLDAPFRAAGAATNLAAAMRRSLDRMRLDGAGSYFQLGSASTPLVSDDPNHPGVLDYATGRLAQSLRLGDGTDQGGNRLASLRGTDLELMLMDTDQSRLAPGAAADAVASSPSLLEQASPVRGQSAATRRLRAQLGTQLQGWECDYDAGFSNDMLLGLARRLAGNSPTEAPQPINVDDPDDAPVAFGRSWNFDTGRVDDQGRHVLDYDLMFLYAEQFVHHGVLAHELGHSLGQRHNFTASADAINYFDNYWRVRGKGHTPQPLPGGGGDDHGIRPRYQYVADPSDHYYSQDEINGRIDEYAYSSVMDYKGLNEDAHGLGRYDFAFVKNGYVGLAEAFRDVADPARASQYARAVMGSGLSTPFAIQGNQIRGLHYTQIPQIFGRREDGTPNLGDDNRYNVFLRETLKTPDLEPSDAYFAPSFTDRTADGHVLVPYRFDTDERAGLVWQDQRYDAGADAYESLHYVTERYLDYYFMNSFARQLTGFSIDSYMGRQWGRYLDQLHQTTQLLAFDLYNWQDVLTGNPGFDHWMDDPAEAGGYVNTAAINLAADAFVNMLTMPEMGAHANVPRFDGSPLVTPTYNGRIDIAIDDGRAFESTWDSAGTGFWWDDALFRAGSYYDKTNALQVLTDPQLSLLGRDTPTDVRQFQLNFYTMFPEQTMRLFGALLSEDYADFAPIYSTHDGAIQRVHLATINLPPGAGEGHSGRVLDDTHLPLDPQAAFTTQLWSAVQTVAEFPATYDGRYTDFARVWIDGSVESITLPDPDTQTVSYQFDDLSPVYRALHISAATNVTGQRVGASALVHAETGAVADEAGIGARMLLHLRDLKALRLRAAASGDAARATSLAEQENSYLALVNVMRRLTQQFGTGRIILP